MIGEENAPQMHETCLRWYLCDSFLSHKTIATMKDHSQIMQGGLKDLLSGSVATRIILKMSRFGRQANEHLSVMHAVPL